MQINKKTNIKPAKQKHNNFIVSYEMPDLFK